MRNLAAKVSSKQQAAVKTVFTHTDPDELDQQWDVVSDSLAAAFPKVADGQAGKRHREVDPYLALQAGLL